MLPSRTTFGGLGWARLVGALGLGALLLHLAGVAGEAQPPGVGEAEDQRCDDAIMRKR